MHTHKEIQEYFHEMRRLFFSLPEFDVPFMCFLLTATFFTVIFVFTAQSFCIAETPGLKKKRNAIDTSFLSELYI